MVKEKIKLYLDFDSTIVDSISRFVSMANEIYELNKSSEDVCDYKFKDLYPGIKEEDIVRIFSMKEFFNEDLKFMKQCKEILNKHKDNYEIIIITASSGNNLMYKRLWIKDNLPFIKKVLATNGNDKSSEDMSNSIQIDDVIDCLKTNAEIKILFKNNKNYKWQQHMNDEIYDVNTWEEIDSMLDYYSQEGLK